MNDTGTTVDGSSGRLASAIRIRNSRSRQALRRSRCAVFLRGNSPKYSSMYWISRAPLSRGYCLIRYSNRSPSEAVRRGDARRFIVSRHGAGSQRRSAGGRLPRPERAARARRAPASCRSSRRQCGRGPRPRRPTRRGRNRRAIACRRPGQAPGARAHEHQPRRGDASAASGAASPSGPCPAVDADAVDRRRIDRREPRRRGRHRRRGHAPAGRQRGRDRTGTRRPVAARRRRTRASAAAVCAGRPPGFEEQRDRRRRRAAPISGARNTPREALGRHVRSRPARLGLGRTEGARHEARRAAACAATTRRRRRARAAPPPRTAARASRGVRRATRRETCWCGRCRRRRRDTRRARARTSAGCDQVSASVAATGPGAPADRVDERGHRAVEHAAAARGARTQRVDGHGAAGLIRWCTPAAARSGTRVHACSADAPARRFRSPWRAERHRNRARHARREVSRCTSLAISRWMKATILQSARIVVHNSSSARAARPGWISAATRKERIGLADGICSTFRSHQEHS